MPCINLIICLAGAISGSDTVSREREAVAPRKRPAKHYPVPVTKKLTHFYPLRCNVHETKADT
eukprot:6191297-Pleurochrysis_carterae.AAC.1